MNECKAANASDTMCVMLTPHGSSVFLNRNLLKVATEEKSEIVGLFCKEFIKYLYYEYVNC